MKVIFLQDVSRVGKRGDVKDVNGGYAINFLFPKKLAEAATPKALAELEQRKNQIKIEKEIQKELLEKNLEELKGKVVRLKAKADEKGHLFSGIHKKEIVAAMQQEHRTEISLNSLILEKPIKQTGEFEIPIEVPASASGGKGKKSSFKLIVEKI